MNIEIEQEEDSRWIAEVPDLRRIKMQTGKLLLIFLLLPFLSWAQEIASISGVVRDKISAKPIPNIQIRAGTTRTTTDKDGGFCLSLPAGKWKITARGQGYGLETRTVKVTPNQITRVDFELMPQLTFYGEEFVVEKPKPSPQKEVTLSKETIKADQIKDSSVALFNDFSETLKTLPGVITIGDFSGALYVRGGYPLETIYVLDRVFIPWPYRWGGNLSIFNTRLIDEVDFYSGGFPAEAGNSLAGVIDIRYKKADMKKFSGLLEISPTTTELLLEGPLKKDRSSWLLSAKRTWYDLIAKFFTERKAGNVFPYFDDGFFKLYFDLSTRHKLTLSSLYAGEGMDMEIEETDDPDVAGGHFGYDYQKGIFCMDHQWIPREKLSLQTTLALAIDDGDFNFYHPEQVWDEKMKVKDTSLRSDLDWCSHPSHRLRTGTYLYHSNFNVTGRFEYEEIEGAGTDTLTKVRKVKRYNQQKKVGYIGLYTWDRWQITPRLTGDLGLRYEYFDLTRDSSLTPKLSLKLTLSDKTSLKVAYTHNSMFPIDIYQLDQNIGNPDLKTQKGTDYILGLEKELSKDVRLKAEAYYKDLKDLVIADEQKNFLNKGKGYAKGIELFLQKREGGKLDGWISYAYSVSKRRRGDNSYRLEDGKQGVSDDPELYPTEQDRTHTLSIVANYRPSSKWKLSTRWRLNTGNPYTPLQGVITTAGTPTTLYKPVWGKYNSGRMPGYQTLDMKVERLFKKSSVYFQFLNLYNHKNVYDYYWTDDYSQRQEFKMFGFMCFGGFELKF